MAIRIDPALNNIPHRLRRDVDDEVAFGRGPLRDVVLPLNDALLRRAEHIEGLRGQLRVEQNKSYALTEILCRIHALLTPEDIGIEGQMLRFKHPDPHEYLRAISKAIRQIPEDLKKAEHAAPNRF